MHSIDCRCQTRVAVAARKLGIINSDLVVAMSLSVAHKALGFDRRMPEIDFDTLDLPSTGTLPIAKDPAAPSSARTRQQPRKPADSTVPAQPRA